MDQEEFNYQGEITAGSSCRQQEDTITRLNGRGAFYYMGSELGALVRISSEGTLQMGTYEEAMPHIGEAIFTVKAEKNCDSFNVAFQCVRQLGGRMFLTDISSDDGIPLNM